MVKRSANSVAITASVALSTVAIMEGLCGEWYVHLYTWWLMQVYTHLGIQVIFVDSQPMARIMHALQRHHLWATYMDLELS